MEKIQVKYFTDVYEDTGLIYNGDWVDVRVSDKMFYFCRNTQQWKSVKSKLDPHGHRYFRTWGTDLVKIGLGFALKLPEGYEAILRPRSSTSKSTAMIFASSGVIDESYCGDNDEWFGVFYTIHPCEVFVGERIAQFRIQKKQPELIFETVDKLDSVDRSGCGSSGRF